MPPPVDWERLLEALRPGADVAGVGVDLQRVDSFRDRRRDPRSLFTEEERRYCESRADPWESYTGTWCAKEAVVKALAGGVRLSVRDVEIRRDPGGRPVVSYGGGVSGAVGERYRVLVSIAHADGVAAAVAVAAAGLPEGP